MSMWKETPVGELRNEMTSFNDFEYTLPNIKRMNYGELMGDSLHRTWTVLSPAVQPISINHIYSTHGQFADWETNARDSRPHPEYIQRDSPNAKFPWQA